MLDFDEDGFLLLFPAEPPSDAFLLPPASISDSLRLLSSSSFVVLPLLPWPPCRFLSPTPDFFSSVTCLFGSLPAPLLPEADVGRPRVAGASDGIWLLLFCPTAEDFCWFLAFVFGVARFEFCCFLDGSS